VALTQSPFVLSDDLLERCAQRAAAYDRENRFFFEDFDELREAKYLLSAVPKEFGGLGLTLAEICQEQRRLARRSAPTALATNMHLLATGIAAHLWRKGDKSQAWILEEAARGAVFAYGYSESGNDLEVLYASGKAERVDGGYRFFGHKHFGSLTPVWNWLKIYGFDAADPDDPKIVHAVMARDTPGYRIVETWDTLGMRATASQDTVLEGAIVPDRHVIRLTKPGFAGADDFILTIFGRFEPAIANIYIGLAERARFGDREDQEEDIGRRNDAFDGVPPRNTAHNRRYRDRVGGDDRARRSDRRGLDERRRPRRSLASQAGRREIPLRRRRLPGGRSGNGRLGRPGDVQGRRAGTPLPRCSMRQVPPGECDDGA
jgi:hypothetical protein